jgi:hypothetical protein
MTVSVKAPTSTTGSIQLNGSDVLTIDSSGNLTAPNNLTVTGSVTAGSGLGNAPYFHGNKVATQTLTRASWTKLTGFTGNELDSDSAFDGTTFTVPSGKGGVYYIFAQIQTDYTQVGNDGQQSEVHIYKNGSGTNLESRISHQNVVSVSFNILTVSTQGMLNLSAGDTIEVYALLIDQSGGNARVGSSFSTFGAYKIG